MQVLREDYYYDHLNFHRSSTVNCSVVIYHDSRPVKFTNKNRNASFESYFRIFFDTP